MCVYGLLNNLRLAPYLTLSFSHIVANPNIVLTRVINGLFNNIKMELKQNSS